MEYKTTERIRALNHCVYLLESHISSIFNQPFWQKQVSIADKLTYLREIARVRSVLFDEVEREYPELKNKLYSVSRVKIEGGDKMEGKSAEELKKEEEEKAEAERKAKEEKGA